MNTLWLGVIAVLLVSLGGLIVAIRRGEPGFRVPAKSTKRTSLKHSDPIVRQFCEELRELDAMPILSKQDRARWNGAAQAMRVKLRRQYAAIYDSLPHEIEHYLDDADIRAKDPTYAKQQRADLADLLT